MSPRLLALALLGAAGGCAPTANGPPGAGASAPVGVLVFGDSGYHYDWLEAEDHERPLTGREFIIEELDDWLEDHRPIEEFRPPPMHLAEQTGGYVMASGLWPVARAMQSWCAVEGRCGFGLMLGDNIYPDGATLGADGRDDAQRFDELLYRPYAPLPAQRPGTVIYPVLGNHDWNSSREGAMAQVEFLKASPLYRMDGIFYGAEAAPGVEIFAIDTTVLLAAETVYEEAIAPDGSESIATVIDEPDPWVRPQGEEQRMAEWLEQALADSRARWKLVIGHHPLWSSSSGKHQQAKVLRELILPALCRYADAYLAGHEHTLELHADDCRTAVDDPGIPPLLTVVSGAAGKQRPLHSTFMAYQDRTYPQKKTLFARGLVWGFAHMTLAADAGTVTMISTPDSGSGEPVVEYTHEFERRSDWQAPQR